MSASDRIAMFWNRIKAPLFMFIVGIIVGPFISGYMGWQVTNNTLEKHVHEALLGEQAAACAWRASQNAEDLANLSYDAQQELANKYAVLPWDGNQANYTLESRCRDLLSHSVEDASAKAG